MRAGPVILAGLLATCSPPDPARQEARAAKEAQPPLTSGEARTQIAPRGEAAATLRSGPRVPVALPSGFTLYPGASVIANTRVERRGQSRVLLVFETPDTIDKVMRHYRDQAEAAGAVVALDVGSDERASISGELPQNGQFAISARRAAGITRVELAAS